MNQVPGATDNDTAQRSYIYIRYQPCWGSVGPPKLLMLRRDNILKKNKMQSRQGLATHIEISCEDLPRFNCRNYPTDKIPEFRDIYKREDGNVKSTNAVCP
ncbi:hypothetical protein [Paraburkholderia adhaesiva]|uniref:hypothetical protein n=1 Tax=Paraburkholderia adhaesiva TaxID=2883244 RepID=UPI001F1DD769|nr:hypothetical protein [Paraburkholderia adhaesiva]